MIRAYAAQSGRLRNIENPLTNHDVAVWIDLLSPTHEEETAVEAALGVSIPTRDEMEEIEVSSRLFHDDGAVFMTATLPAQTDSANVLVAPVTFVLTADRLVTVRYHDPRVFHTFPQRAEKVAIAGDGCQLVLIGLLEAIVERLADVLERAARDIDGISRSIFEGNHIKPGGARNFQEVLEAVGRKADLLSHVRDSLVTFERLFGFFGQTITPRGSDPTIRARVKSLGRDGRSLSAHASSLSQKNTFLLDATLGMINIEQNATIKMFSVAAVVLLPPTLVASVYGMNFEHMPELRWLLGYPAALIVMALSAIVPFWYSRRRGWL
jgi:magnesium transporter